MPDANTSSKLLEPALPGAWIAEHRRIWQMDFLNADKLARFSHDRGASYFNETDVIQLWQLGLLKADLIISPRKLRLVGLTYRGIDFNGVCKEPIYRITAAFKTFIETLFPVAAHDPEALGLLYNTRSRAVHGSGILLSDSHLWIHFMEDKQAMDEYDIYERAYLITKVVLYNWLYMR